MKQLTSLLLFFSLIGCYPVRTSSVLQEKPIEENLVIYVEYRNELFAKETILQTLRLQRIADLNICKDNAFENITARYGTISMVKAEEIKDRLIQMAGVLHVEIKHDGSVVKNAGL